MQPSPRRPEPAFAPTPCRWSHSRPEQARHEAKAAFAPKRSILVARGPLSWPQDPSVSLFNTSLLSRLHLSLCLSLLRLGSPAFKPSRFRMFGEAAKYKIDSVPLGPDSRPMPRVVWWSWGGGLFLMSEEPLYRNPFGLLIATLNLLNQAGSGCSGRRRSTRSPPPPPEFKFPWREAGPPNHHNGKVDSDQ